VTPCHWVSVSRCLTGTYWLHLQWFWGPWRVLSVGQVEAYRPTGPVGNG